MWRLAVLTFVMRRFQILVLLQRARCHARETAEDQRDEHEQSAEALQPGNGSLRSHLTGQKPLGESPRQTHSGGMSAPAASCSEAVGVTI